MFCCSTFCNDLMGLAVYIVIQANLRYSVFLSKLLFASIVGVYLCIVDVLFVYLSIVGVLFVYCRCLFVYCI